MKKVLIGTHNKGKFKDDFIKAYPTFTKFLPDFRKMFSSAFASYVVENMQSSFLDAQPGVGEFFNTFNK